VLKRGEQGCKVYSREGSFEMGVYNVNSTDLQSSRSTPFPMAWLKYFPSPMSVSALFSENPSMTLNSLFSTVREKMGKLKKSQY